MTVKDSAYSPMAQLAISTAKKAGAYLLAHFRQDTALLLARGSSKEVTTRYDKEADALILSELRSAHPNHSFLTEESGASSGEGPYTWIIDSLDGSGNFASGNPYFSVSIALLKGDETVLGVVYAPFLGELYVAEKGHGSTLNGSPLRVSPISDLANAYVVTCEGTDAKHVRIAKAYPALLAHVKDYRKIGSAALECCMVAAGRADGYVTFGIEPWDVAAGILVATEAGAKVTDFHGVVWSRRRSDLVASNGKVHDALLAAVKDI